jgi:hypothetical protein
VSCVSFCLFGPLFHAWNVDDAIPPSNPRA